MSLLYQRRLKNVLVYDPDTGIFTWRIPRQNVKVGAVAGHTEGKNGYRLIRVEGCLYKAHRLAWLYIHGKWPRDQIDHINGVRDDNRIANLREATHAQNQQNLSLRPRNTSGYTGVTWAAKARKWKAQISVSNRKIYLGSFDDPAEAHLAYLEGKKRYHAYQPTIRAA